MESKIRGASGGSTGQITWDFGDMVHLLEKDVTHVCFKYFKGSSSEAVPVATSPIVAIKKVTDSGQVRLRLGLDVTESLKLHQLPPSPQLRMSFSFSIQFPT